MPSGIGCAVDFHMKYYGGGSGGGFIGQVYLTKGTYTIKVGAGQHYTRNNNDGNTYPVTYWFSKPEVSSISGVVSCSGADRTTAGTAPSLSITPRSTTLNKAGNPGGNDGTEITDYQNPITSGMISGAAVYQNYGFGSTTSPYSTMISGNTASTCGNGYVKIIFKGR